MLSPDLSGDTQKSIPFFNSVVLIKQAFKNEEEEQAIKEVIEFIKIYFDLVRPLNLLLANLLIVKATDIDVVTASV